MIKKLLALAATALFSMNASAGYVQYDFAHGSANGGLEGYIIQHDTDQSIAAFAFWLSDYREDFGWSFSPQDSEGYVRIASATTYFRKNGPTNFVIEDSFGADHYQELTVRFSRGISGNFNYTASYVADLYENQPPVIYSGTVRGTATKVRVDPFMADYLDSLGGYDYAVDRVVPEYIGPNKIPEPTSIALLSLGAAGLAAASRRRVAAK